MPGVSRGRTYSPPAAELRRKIWAGQTSAQLVVRRWLCRSPVQLVAAYLPSLPPVARSPLLLLSRHGGWVTTHQSCRYWLRQAVRLLDLAVGRQRHALVGRCMGMA